MWTTSDLWGSRLGLPDRILGRADVEHRRQLALLPPLPDLERLPKIASAAKRTNLIGDGRFKKSRESCHATDNAPGKPSMKGAGVSHMRMKSQDVC